MRKLLLIHGMGMALTLTAGAAQAETFSLSSCEAADQGIFRAQFVGDTGANRALTMNPTRNAITFKGNGTGDFSWSARFDDISYLSVDTSNNIAVHFKYRWEKAVGRVDPDCRDKIRAHLGDRVRLRVIGG